MKESLSPEALPQNSSGKGCVGWQLQVSGPEKLQGAQALSNVGLNALQHGVFDFYVADTWYDG